MKRKILFAITLSILIFTLKGVIGKSALAADQAIVMADLDNRTGTIPITVSVIYYHGGTSTSHGPQFGNIKSTTVAAGARVSLYSDLDSGDFPYYWISWSTSCTDPPALAAYSGLWGDGVGPGVAAYQTDPQDVHCTTTNSEPSITSTSCATVGWTLIGVGANGANVDHFAIFRGPVGDTNPDDNFITNLGSSARSYDFGSLGSGTYYVRVSAVSPQGSFSAPSYGQFTCSSVVIGAASGLNANLSCNGSGSGNIVNAAFGWTTSSPNPSDEQWIDYSVANNNFTPGPYLQNANVGPGTQVYTTSGLAQGITYYWRINNRYGTNWYPSSTATLVTPTCPPGVVPTPTPTPLPAGTCPSGCTQNKETINWSAVTYRVHICIAGVSFPNSTYCQGDFTTTNNYRNFTVASLQSYDVHVDISDGSNWYGWVNKTDGTDCLGPATCSYRISWTAVRYIVNSNIDNIDHTTSSTTYDYTSFPFNFSYTGTIKFNDFGGLGSSHTWGSFNGTTPANPCNCPATPTPVPLTITLTGYSDCVDGVNPRVHLTWTSNTQSDNYRIYRDGVLQVTMTTDARTWDSPAQPSGAHSWIVQGTGGVNPTTNSNPVSITTATCSPPPADPSNLSVSSVCGPSGTPVITFSWTDNSNIEQGFWMDVSHDAFTGPSSTTASPSVWGVKAISPIPAAQTTAVGDTVQFVWNTAVASISQGPLDSGDADSAVTGNQLTPERGVTYYWRVKAFSSSQQSNHIYSGGTDGADADTIADGSKIPPGISFTTPNCYFDLRVINNGSTQTYDPGAMANLKVRVYNTPQGQVPFTGGAGTIGLWPTGGTLPNCSASPQVPQSPPLSQSITSTLNPNADETNLTSYQDFTFTFTVSNTPGTYFANFYALPNCTPAENNNPSTWSNNAFQLTYAVSAKAWFETTGGDVGARGNIQVSNTSIPAGHMQSTAALAGNPLGSNVVGLWELNNYAHPVFPTDSSGVYGYFKSRFYQKITGSANSYNKCGGPMVVTNGSTGLVDGTPVADNFYYCSGDLTLRGDGNAFHMLFPTNHYYVVYVGGNLNIKDDGLVHTGALTLGSTSVVFLVQGDVNVDTKIVRTDGVYIVGGTFNDYDTVGGTIGNQLSVYGAIYAHAFNLGRILSNLSGCDPTCTNSKTPADIIYYQPRYLVALTQMIGSPSISWQEVAP